MAKHISFSNSAKNDGGPSFDNNIEAFPNTEGLIFIGISNDFDWICLSIEDAEEFIQEIQNGINFLKSNPL